MLKINEMIEEIKSYMYNDSIQIVKDSYNKDINICDAISTHKNNMTKIYNDDYTYMCYLAALYMLKDIMKNGAKLKDSKIIEIMDNVSDDYHEFREIKKEIEKML